LAVLHGGDFAEQPRHILAARFQRAFGHGPLELFALQLRAHLLDLRLVRQLDGRDLGLQELDLVGLLPTTDKYAVMAAMETNGDNYNIGTSGVIAWMKDMEKDHAYVLTGIGFDYMEGHLILPVKDAKSLAARMYEFCPDIVDQGVGDKDKLVAELEKGKLYFWWD